MRKFFYSAHRAIIGTSENFFDFNPTIQILLFKFIFNEFHIQILTQFRGNKTFIGFNEALLILIYPDCFRLQTNGYVSIISYEL